jgi:hypothetical protein
MAGSLLDAYAELPEADSSSLASFRRETAALHERLVRWCHKDAPDGRVPSGTQLAHDAMRWHQAFDSAALAVGLVNPAAALDWSAISGGFEAGWHPDPSRRFAYRYFDGSRWTASVSNGGVTLTDEADWARIANDGS